MNARLLLTNNWIEMDPSYEQRLLHVQNGQHSSQGQIFRSPAKETYSDRFIPSRSSAIFQMKLNVKPDDRSQAVVQPSANQKSNVDSCKDRVAYSCLLKNELLGAGIEDVKDQQMDGQRAALVPKETKNFFQYRIPSIASCSSELSPYSLSPVGNKSQRLLRSPRKALRKISRIPFKVLDAPELQDDFYLNLVDWSSQNILSVGLGSCVYLWSACTSQVTRLCDLSSEGDTVTSVSWNERGNLISVGTHKGFTQIWDVSATKKLSTLLGHQARVGALAWNADMLASGSRDRMILLRDTRCPSVMPEKKLAGHRQEVCGLKWSPDHQHLASGGNDNKLYIWNTRSINPVQIYSEHMAAVKAIAWSPHQHGLLASGGGTADKRIRFWNTITGRPLQCIDTGSQVCNLAWSKHSSELVSTHGYSQNQILVWKYPSLIQIAKLTGHTFRVLYLMESFIKHLNVEMPAYWNQLFTLDWCTVSRTVGYYIDIPLAMSPDGESIVTGAGDETLRFWNIFNKTRSTKDMNSALNLFTRIR